MASKGAVDITQVDQSKYRDDLGFKMSDAQYEQYGTEEADFNTQYGDVMTTNQTALDSYGDTMGSLVDAPEPTYAQNVSADEAWGKAAQTFQTIRVVNGNNIEEVYHLPAETIEALDTKVFNIGDGSYTGNYVHDGIYNVDVTPRGIGDSYGTELHELIRGAEISVQDKFYEDAAPQLALANEQIDAGNTAARDAWNAYNTEVSGAQGTVQGYIDIAEGNIADANNSKTVRDTQKERYKEQYGTNLAKRKALFA